MIRIDALWLCSQPQDMRAGADRLLTVVVNTLGEVFDANLGDVEDERLPMLRGPADMAGVTGFWIATGRRAADGGGGEADGRGA